MSFFQPNVRQRAVVSAASLIVISTTLGSACSVAESSSADAPRTDVAPIAVTAERVESRDVPAIIRATGSFVPDESSDVATSVAGQVLATPVNVGDFVKAGQVLVRLNDRDARLRLQQAQASLEQAAAQAANADQEAERNAELVASGDISRSSYDRLTTLRASARAAVAQATAQVALAQQAVDDLVVRAPFSGHVTARSIAAGEYVTTSSRLATIVRIQPIKLELGVADKDAAVVRPGLTVHARVAAYPDRVFEGRVTAVNPAIDPASRAKTIEATFANVDSRLNPGMFATVDIDLPTTVPALFVPSSAVAPGTSEGSSTVYVVRDGVADLRVVQVDRASGGLVRVVSGLSAGETVATTDVDQLFAGAPVTARPSELSSVR